MRLPLLFILCLSALALTSCATILSSKHQSVKVYSNAAASQITYNDSVYQLPVTLRLKRSKKPLQLHFSSSASSYDTVVKRRINELFLLGNIPSIPFFGLGYGVDFTNQKRFKYPRTIFLNDNASKPVYIIEAEEYISRKQLIDSLRITRIYVEKKESYLKKKKKREAHDSWVYKRYNPEKGTVYFNLILPSVYMMEFSNKNPDLNASHTLGGGISFGIALDYFYKNNKFATLEVSHKSNMFDPIFFYAYDVKDKIDISVMEGYRWHRWQFSYGVMFTHTLYAYSVKRNEPVGGPVPYFSDDNDSRSYQNNYSSLGFSTVINYQFMPRMFVGISYKPAVYSFRKQYSGLDYEHILGLDLRVKF